MRRKVLMVFCLIGLLYQLETLYQEYMSGKTVVKLNVRRKLYDKLPAITICLDRIFSIKKIKEADQSMNQTYASYLDVLNKFKTNPPPTPTPPQNGRVMRKPEKNSDPRLVAKHNRKPVSKTIRKPVSQQRPMIAPKPVPSVGSKMPNKPEHKAISKPEPKIAPKIEPKTNLKTAPKPVIKTHAKQMSSPIKSESVTTNRTQIVNKTELKINRSNRKKRGFKEFMREFREELVFDVQGINKIPRRLTRLLHSYYLKMSQSEIFKSIDLQKFNETTAEFNNEMDSIIELNIDGVPWFYQNITEIHYDGQFKNVLEPIRSYVFNKNLFDSHKCFTFFSDLNPESRKFRMKLDFIEFRIKFSYRWFPPTLMNNIRFSLHSPNTLPELNNRNFLNFSIRHDYIIQYSSIETQLLDNRYDTDCVEYDLNNKNANYNMRSDCITHCYNNFLIRQCGIPGGLVYSSHLMRTQYLEQNEPVLMEELDQKCRRKFSTKAETNCLRKCKVDCKYNYYAYVTNAHSNADFNRELYTTLILEHNHLPDVTIEYLPQMNFISFVCSFGGLLGMWLGLSFLTIFDEIIRVVKGFVLSQKPVINFNKYFYFPTLLKSGNISCRKKTEVMFNKTQKFSPRPSPLPVSFETKKQFDYSNYLNY